MLAIAASSRLSTSSCRMIRPRVAPMARRTAISFCRCSARTSSRPAASAHAMSITSATTPSRTHDMRRYCTDDCVSVTRLAAETTFANGSRSSFDSAAARRLAITSS